MGISLDSAQGSDKARELYRNNKNTEKYETELDVFSRAAKNFVKEKDRLFVNDLVGKYGDKKASELYKGGPKEGLLRFWTRMELQDMLYEAYDDEKS